MRKAARKSLRNSHLRAAVAVTLQSAGHPPQSVPWCIKREDGVVLRLTVQPRSAREGFDGTQAGRLRLKVAAPPVDDAANDRVVTLIAARAGVPRRAVQILRGARSRTKDVLVRDAGARWERFASSDADSGAAAAPGDRPEPGSPGRAARKP